MDAAERIFLARGFHATTMAAVASQSGMSKKTLYQLFDSKDALLAAIVERRFAPLTRPPEPDAGRALRDTLRDLLLQAVTFILSPQEIDFTRLLIADRGSGAAMARALGPQSAFIGRTTLVRWLANQATALRLADAQEAAALMIGMALGDWHVRLLLRSIDQPSAQQLQHRVDRAVEVFLTAIVGNARISDPA